MPSLVVQLPDGSRIKHALVKTITSVGSSRDADLVVPASAAPDVACLVRRSGPGHLVAAADSRLLVNGREVDEHALAWNDAVKVGGLSLSYVADAPQAVEAADPRAAELQALQRLAALGELLLGRYELAPALEMLMDQVIALTRADKGFLILMEDGELQVKVARNLDKRSLEDAVSTVSDSIVKKVVETKRPLIVSDALHDESFSSSESVVNLKLLSVMAAPLTARGELMGLLYVGNDRVVNRFDLRALELLTVFAAQASLMLQNALLVGELKLENTGLKKQLEFQNWGDLVGACQGMKDVYRKVEKVAGTDISVLITGETGTGKELIARELHRRSPRAKGPFITLNCGAIPESLLESELFGHVKGSFTGAIATRPGKFQAAHGGTLFLDEIGEMPPALQVKILRALQERVVTKVGDTRGESVDIRVVAATHRVLEEEIKTGRFREDLYYRLNVVALRLPPLRERGEDVPVLAKWFLARYAKEFSSRVKGFSPAGLVALRKYAWPGNVRELENRVKKAVVLADKPLVGPEDLELSPESLEPVMPLLQAKEEFQKRYINEVLARNGGNRTKSAKDLGVDPRTIFRHLEQLRAEQGLPPEPETE